MKFYVNEMHDAETETLECQDRDETEMFQKNILRPSQDQDYSTALKVMSSHAKELVYVKSFFQQKHLNISNVYDIHISYLYSVLLHQR